MATEREAALAKFIDDMDIGLLAHGEPSVPVEIIRTWMSDLRSIVADALQHERNAAEKKCDDEWIAWTDGVNEGSTAMWPAHAHEHRRRRAKESNG